MDSGFRQIPEFGLNAYNPSVVLNHYVILTTFQMDVR